MNHSTKIIIGNITNLSDARYAAASGADYISFCFDTFSPNYIPPVKAKEMIDWVSGIKIIASFGNQSKEEIETIVSLINIDEIEVEKEFLPDDFSEIDIPIIKKINLNETDETKTKVMFEMYKEKVNAFHLYTSSPFDKSIYENLLKELCLSVNIIWELDVNENNIASIITDYKPYAIQLTGSDEEKTGYKDFEEMDKIVEKILAERV